MAEIMESILIITKILINSVFDFDMFYFVNFPNSIFFMRLLKAWKKAKLTLCPLLKT